MKRLIFVFLSACSGASGASLGGDPAAPQDKADAASVSADVGGSMTSETSLPQADAGDSDSGQNELDANQAPDAVEDVDVPDANNCPQGCVQPEVCGGSGNPKQCGDSCMTHPEWITACRAKSGNLSKWAVPFGCNIAYEVVGGTVSYRANGVAGCVTIDVAGASTPVQCCP